MQRSFPWTGASLVVLAGGAAVLLHTRAEPPALPPQAFRDLGVACLALGRVSPTVEEWSDRGLTAVVELLARLMHAYGQADFGSFLALRAGDLEHVRQAKASEIECYCEVLDPT